MPYKNMLACYDREDPARGRSDACTWYPVLCPICSCCSLFLFTAVGTAVFTVLAGLVPDEHLVHGHFQPFCVFLFTVVEEQRTYCIRSIVRRSVSGLAQGRAAQGIILLVSGAPTCDGGV